MISVIVPVLNEAATIGPALTELLAQGGDFEVIVVDGGSTDGTWEAAEQVTRVRCIRSDKGRGRQMNAGAAHARGELLLFLHADTRLAPGAFEAIERARKGGVQAGAFTHRFGSDDWRLRLISAGHNMKCRLNGIYYGDHGIFVARNVFDGVGGFPEVPILEDVIFCERLRKLARGRLLPEVATTDARRFLRHGVWRSTARALLILARHRLGLPTDGRGFSDEVR